MVFHSVGRCRTPLSAERRGVPGLLFYWTGRRRMSSKDFVATQLLQIASLMLQSVVPKPHDELLQADYYSSTSKAKRIHQTESLQFFSGSELGQMADLRLRFRTHKDAGITEFGFPDADQGMCWTGENTKTLFNNIDARSVLCFLDRSITSSVTFGPRLCCLRYLGTVPSRSAGLWQVCGPFFYASTRTLTGTNPLILALWKTR
ncbi:hypothetical protein C8R47DRAFT_89245 [Mycena vitilis]|nr:hypothetical protein C8R47DRAFT_89245 [Mycena vitilis]